MTQRPTPLLRHPEGARFELIGPPDDHAGVEHYWARRSFYAALHSYAKSAYDELAEAAPAPLAVQNVNSTDHATPFGQFLEVHDETLQRWCRRYAFYAAGQEESRSRQGPGWLWADMVHSYLVWYPKQGQFPMRAIWRDRGAPVVIDEELIEADPDSAELRALLRIDLVGTEVDEHGLAVPVVITQSQAMAELVQRFKAFVEPKIPDLLASAAARGIRKPSDAVLDTAMRRYVLKQFRRLDSLDIAACEVRGDLACIDEATDEERNLIADDRTRRRDVDDSIKQASDTLGIPARRNRTGRRAKRSLAARRA